MALYRSVKRMLHPVGEWPQLSYLFLKAVDFAVFRAHLQIAALGFTRLVRRLSEDTSSAGLLLRQRRRNSRATFRAGSRYPSPMIC